MTLLPYLERLFKAYDESRHPRGHGGKWTAVGPGEAGGLPKRLTGHKAMELTSMGYLHHDARTVEGDHMLVAAMKARGWSNTKQAHFIVSTHGRHAGDALTHAHPTARAANLKAAMNDFHRRYHPSQF